MKAAVRKATFRLIGASPNSANVSTLRPANSRPAVSSALPAVALFALCTTATLTISVGDNEIKRILALGQMLLGVLALGLPLGRFPLPGKPVFVLLFSVAAWGWGQLALGGTVYRYATKVAAIHWVSGLAVLFIAAVALRPTALRRQFLLAFAWFGFAVGVAGVLTNLTSPDRILWVFPSAYPDTWGPFLSRNDFAMLLELSFPVAFWATGMGAASEKALPVWVPAAMLAAGLASASRAGAALLVVEAVVLLAPVLPGSFLSNKRTGRRSGFRARAAPAAFLFMVLMAASLAGTGTLWGRLQAPDPFQFRRQIAASAMAMIAERPFQGFGLGTFAEVYPAYATIDIGAVVEHAHNDWLEWAAEGGLPFALLWLLLGIRLAIPAIRSGWGIGLVALFLHALVDYPFAKFGLTAWTFALAGMLQAQGERTPSPNALTIQTQHKEIFL